VRPAVLVLTDVNDVGVAVIQGNADAGSKLTQGEVSKTIDFCLKAFHPVKPEERQAIQGKINGTRNEAHELEKLSEDELRVLDAIRARRLLRTEDTLNLDNFRKDAIGGFMPNLKHGKLGLVEVSKFKVDDDGFEGAAAPTDVFDVINLESIASKQEAPLHGT
jgi:hypothetical protein